MWNFSVLLVKWSTGMTDFQSYPLVQNWGPHGPRPKQKHFFFSEIIKPDPKLSKPFYFNKIPYVLAKL